MKRGTHTNKLDNSKFIFARIMPRFGLRILRIFCEILIFKFKCGQTGTAEC